MKTFNRDFFFYFFFLIFVTQIYFADTCKLLRKIMKYKKKGSLTSVDSSISSKLEGNITNINSMVTNEKGILNALPEITKYLKDAADLTEELTVNDIISYTISSLLNEDADTNVLQFIEKYGYKYENHTVETEDDYLLSLVRIPGAGKPVFVMHGFLSSCDDFVTPGNDKGLAFILAAKGFDVWMGNARGTKHSRNHKTLSTDSEEFWNFSWHEIGIYDLPAMIDYTLNATRQSELIYIGHSQGTTSFFVMTSERPEYNDKISLMISLATVAWMNHVKSVTYRASVPLRNYYAEQAYLSGQYEFIPSNEFLKIFADALCSIPLPLCSNILFLMAGFSYDQIDMALLPVILAHTPGGGSMKQFLHYAQEFNPDKFQKYDYGEDKNLQLYGTKAPPSYPVENIRAPVYMFHTNNDWLSNITDVNVLRSKIPNEVGFYVVPHPTFNHLDYLYGKDVVKLVYNEILRVIEEYTTYD